MNPSLESVRAFARRHRVSADVQPHYDIHDHRRIQTGFDLTLVALRSDGCTGDPGCVHCRRVHDLLGDVACAALPEGWRHVVEPFDAAFHYRRETGWQPEIATVVELLPPGQTMDAVDEASRRELPEILSRLVGVGVYGGKRVVPRMAA
jgi:hypothetical protein